MYNIGLVSLIEESKNNYIDSLSNSTLHIDHLNKDEVVEQVGKYNGIIILENDSQNIGTICELIIRIKKESDVFIWITTEEVHSMSHLVYLQLGVDGIVDKEYDIEKLKLLITNGFDRYMKNSEQESESLKKENEQLSIQLVPSNFSVIVDGGQEISLTKLEFKTMEFLKLKPKEAVSYEEIYKNVWNNEGDDKQYRVSNLIFHLRQKIEKDASHPEFIKTVRSKGYMLNI